MFYFICVLDVHLKKSITNRESNHAWGVHKEHYAYYYVPKSSILLAGGTGVLVISSVACGFSSFKIDYFDHPKSLITRINIVYVLYFIYNRLFCCDHTKYCVNIVSVTSASHYIT